MALLSCPVFPSPAEVIAYTSQTGLRPSRKYMKILFIKWKWNDLYRPKAPWTKIREKVILCRWQSLLPLAIPLRLRLRLRLRL